jgi:hypothetical protein
VLYDDKYVFMRFTFQVVYTFTHQPNSALQTAHGLNGIQVSANASAVVLSWAGAEETLVAREMTTMRRGFSRCIFVVRG